MPDRPAVRGEVVTPRPSPLAVLRDARDFIPDWNDGPSPLRDDYDAALAAVERLVEAAREREREEGTVSSLLLDALAPFKEES